MIAASSSRRALIALVAALLALGFALPMFGQATIQSGSIQGTVTDPTGAVVPGAKVIITSQDTGQLLNFTTTSAGTYVSGPLTPGAYKVRIEAKGFATTETIATVSVGNITPGNIKLKLGREQEVVTVESNVLRVNTEQATVQGVITDKQITDLPINGRNFLDAAQLEPGVQIQDGSNFDPTKIGFTAISVGGRQGRTTRVEVDGLDITDETVGTITMNIPASSIQEFQISQSTMDFSTELTSSGAVNIATKSGSNSVHGDAFYLFRDKRVGSANFPGGQDLPYQRNYAGFSLGGPVVKNKLFFFVAGERVLQHLFAPVTFSDPFQGLSGGFNSPFKDKQGTAKVDYQRGSLKAFYRINYDNFNALGNMVPNYEVIANVNNTPSHAAGLDFTSGSFTHSIRLGYLKFMNGIVTAAAMSGAYNPMPDVPADYRITGISPQLRFGFNYLAPQATFQSDKQFKYDGTKMSGAHIFRFGLSFNKILGGGMANFWGMGPSIRGSASYANAGTALTRLQQTYPWAVAAHNGPFAGGEANPLNYPVTQTFLGNGQGFFTETPQFGMPAGGQWGNRLQLYFGDTWKIRPNVTLTAGLRYNMDKGRTDSDMAPIPCSAMASFDPAPPCAGNLVDNFGFNALNSDGRLVTDEGSYADGTMVTPGLGNRVRQPKNSFGPSLGLAWDPFRNGKTVFRAGAGIYYENIIFNSVMFDRPVRLEKGLFNAIVPGSANLCPSGNLIFPDGTSHTTTPTGKNIATQVCGMPMGSVAADLVALQNEYQQAVAAAGASMNPAFVGFTLQPDAGGGLYAPDFRTPRSYQMNFGVQHELWNNGVLSADFIRNVGERFLVGMDTNHVGDARYLNVTAAENAIANTLSGFTGPGGVECATIDCAIAGGATIADFAANGLDSGWTYLGGSPAEAALGASPNEGAAFAGMNPWYGSNTMQFSIGRSVYNAMQISFRQRASHLSKLFPTANFLVSYSLSRFASLMADQDFVSGAPNDNANPFRNFGPNAFDRTHQLAFGTVFSLPALGRVNGLKFSFIGHFNSPLPQDLRLEDQGREGEIFHTDVTGDGTTGDILPGTNIGSFMRGVSPGNINNVINTYNLSYAGRLTPAGWALVNAGLMTQDQLIRLGAVMDTVPSAPMGQVGNGWLKTFDLKFTAPIKIRESIGLEFSASAYNIFNLANFANSPNTLISGILTGTAGTANGTLYGDQSNRAGIGSGVFQVGAPRQMEFGIRLVF